MNTSHETNEIIPALLKANQQLKNPPANKENPFYESRYTPLDFLTDHIKHVINPLDLFITQNTEFKDQLLYVITRLYHVSGQWIENEVSLPAGKDAQKQGSAITYGRRYGLNTMFNLASDMDDDGNEIVDKIKSMPIDVRQLFIDKGYTKRDSVVTACESLNYDWKKIKKKLEGPHESNK